MATFRSDEHYPNLRSDVYLNWHVRGDVLAAREAKVAGRRHSARCIHRLGARNLSRFWKLYHMPIPLALAWGWLIGGLLKGIAAGAIVGALITE